RRRRRASDVCGSSMPNRRQPARTAMTAEQVAAPPGTPTAYRRLGHRPALDGIRGVAVLLVLLAHMPILVPSLYPDFLPGSFVGVDMFFVLSGFLITTLLLTEQQRTASVSYGNF